MEGFGGPDVKCYPCGGKGYHDLTPRHAMQQLGGEFAEATYPPIYAGAAARAAQKREAEGDVAIITDCRFVRDLQAIHDVGGVIIQLHRGEDDNLIGAASQHGSEVARKTPEFQALVNHHVHNKGTLEELRLALAMMALRGSRPCPYP